MSATRPAPNPERRARLLEAAERLFTAHGYRGVSMARIAEEAGVSRATVYAYFADREHVFRAVAEHVADRIEAAVEDALAGPGDTVARLTRALRAKDGLIFRLASGSPHAAELLEAKDRLVRARFDALDAAVLAAVTATLDDGADRGLPPAVLARLAVRASRGLATRAADVEALEADIALLVPRLLA